MELTSARSETAWTRGSFNARPGPRKLLFGCMYEDAAIELRAFEPGGRIFCIASAGCTAMTLAHSHEVVVVDINRLQLTYAERRVAGAPVQPGSAENVLKFLRRLGPLAGWTRRTVEEFLDLDDPKEQIVYWRRRLDTARFRTAIDLLLSRPVLRLIYSASLLDSLPPNFGAVVRHRMERCFSTHPNRTNPYARGLLLGDMPVPYARGLLLGDMPVRQDVPKIERFQFVRDDAAGFLERQPTGSFAGFSLSNILDGAAPAYKERLLVAVQHSAASGAIVVLRSFREPDFFAPTNHAAEDRAMLWGVVDILPTAELSENF